MTTYDASADRTALPVSATLAWWATAWLRGHVVTDLLLDALGADERLHRLADGAALPVVLGGWRAAGATDVGLALPIEGDPLGLGGPATLNDLALEHGQAVVCSQAAAALVPEVATETVTWHAVAADRRQLPDVGETDRELRRQVLEAANGLAAIDVARWRPEAADLFLDRHRPVPAAPPGVPARCVDLAGRALTALAIADLALEDDGGAVSATEARARRDTLLPLERAARRALVAACSPEVWPPA